MLFSAEQHLAAAKLLRRNGVNGTLADRERFVGMSNSFVICARLAAKDRGGMCLDGFDWTSVDPDWSAIDTQIGRLNPHEIASPPLVPDHWAPLSD
jgi:hypothetical protein